MKAKAKLNWLYYWNITRRIQKLPGVLARMLPDWLVYFAAIRVAAHATTGQYSNTVVPELTAMDALARWEKDKMRGGK